MAPSCTPAAVVAKLNSAVVAAINDPTVHAKLVQSGAVPGPTSPTEFRELLRSELERWGRVVARRASRNSQAARTTDADLAASCALLHAEKKF